MPVCETVYVCIYHLERCLLCAEGCLGVRCWSLLAALGFVGVEGEELEPSLHGLWETVVIFFLLLQALQEGTEGKKKRYAFKTVFSSLLTLKLE